MNPPSGGSSRLVARDIAVTLYPEDSPETTDLILRRRLEAYEEFYNQAKPYPDAEECLEGLFRRGYAMAVMTSNSAARVRGWLEKFKWDKFFQGVVGEGMVAEAKPSPQIVQAAARMISLSPQECYVIGDAKWDIVAGIRAGATTVLICREEAKAKELMAFHPHYCIKDFRELLGIIN